MFAGKYTSVRSSAESIGEAVASPATFYASNANDWCKDPYNNLWTVTCDPEKSGRDQDDLTMRKSIYDPSPVGYKVPAPNAFLNFDKNTANNYDKFGWEFPADNKATIYFPAPCYIENSKGFIEGSFGETGRYGTIGLDKSASGSVALYFNIDKDNANIQANLNHERSYGTAIRPVSNSSKPYNPVLTY